MLRAGSLVVAVVIASGKSCHDRLLKSITRLDRNAICFVIARSHDR